MNGANADQLVPALFLAAAGELPWNEPLRAMLDLFQACTVRLIGLQPGDWATVFSHVATDSLDSQGPDRRLLAVLPQLARLPAGTWVPGSAPLSNDECLRIGPCTSPAPAPAAVWARTSKVYEDETLVVFLALQRADTAAPLADAELDGCRRLGGQLQQAFTLARHQQARMQDAWLGPALLERLSEPALLIDAQLRLRQANPAALRLLAQHPDLRIVDGALLQQGAGARALADKVAQLTLRAPAGGRSDSADRAVLRLSGRSASSSVSSSMASSLLLLLSVLRPAGMHAAFGARPLVLVELHDPDRRPAPDAALVASTFGLTPAEAAVASALAAGLSVQQIAAQRGATVLTVRTQLSRIYDKLGVRRQAELTRAISALRHPAAELRP